MNSYDLIVIGSGPGGYVAAVKAAKLGMNVAVIEKGSIGGTCLNRGCIPTKSLVHATHIYKEMNRCNEYGISCDNTNYDLDKMYEYKDGVLEQLRNGIKHLFKTNKISYYEGTASISKDKKVKISSSKDIVTIQGDKILIATGSVPSVPPINGVKTEGVITSDDLLNNSNLNFKELIIIGGGVISVEFATIFNSLGIDVTIIEAMPRLLPNMDKDISQNLKMILKKRGVNVYTDAMVKSICREDKLKCCFLQKGKEVSVEGDNVLVAIGRSSYTDALFEEGLSIETERGKILVNDSFETSEKGIYAIGDVIKGIQLAHVASAQGIYAVEKMNNISPSLKLQLVPNCVYTDPEIACIGITEEEAKKEEISVITGKCITNSNAKSLLSKQDRGFMKIVAKKDSHEIIGVQMMCARATDMIGEFSTAIANQLTVEDLLKTMRAHPTFNESVTEALESTIK